MIDMKKVIKITTNAFDLTIRWNAAKVGMVASIIFGAIMIRLFSHNSNAGKLVFVVLLFGIVVALLSLLGGIHVEVTDGNGESKSATDVPTEVRREAKPQPRQATPSRKSSGTINNKVGVPTTQQQVEPPTQQPKPEPKTEPQPAASESAPQPEKNFANKSIDEMTDEDWDALFKMD